MLLILQAGWATGPKKTIPDEPVPPPPGMTGIMPEGVQLLTTAGSLVYSPQHHTPAGERIVYSNDSHLAMRGADIGRSFNSGPAEHMLRGAEMRRSFNSGPAEHAVHANNPLYRSFDQGSSLRYVVQTVTFHVLFVFSHMRTT